MLGTIHKSTNQSSENQDRPVPPPVETSTDDPKLRTHHGAVDQEALTSRPPSQVFNQVKQTLKSLGLEFKRDGGEFKLKCARPKKPMKKMQQPPFRMLLRRPSQPTEVNSTIYGDPNVDPGDEVRFSVELCKIKNLPGLYIVDMRRMRGNVWAYKFIYRTLLDTLNLGGKSGYLNTSGSLVAEEEQSNHRMSTASSGAGSSSVMLDESSLAAKQLILNEPKENTSSEEDTKPDISHREDIMKEEITV